MYIEPAHRARVGRGRAAQQQGHVEPLAQCPQGVGIDGAAAGADGRRPGHHGLAADVDQALAYLQKVGAPIVSHFT